MLPTKIKISGIDYEIAIAEHRNDKEGDILLGEIDYAGATIFINEDQSDQMKTATLIHEIVHGILYHMGSKLNEDEYFVEGLASGLYQVIRDNDIKLSKEAPKIQVDQMAEPI